MLDPDFPARPAAQVQWQGDVFEAGEGRQEIEELENEADLVSRTRSGHRPRASRERFAPDVNVTEVGRPARQRGSAASTCRIRMDRDDDT